MFEQGRAGLLTVFADPSVEGETIQATDGEVIYDLNSSAEHLYFIQRGQVRIYTVGRDNLCRLIDILGPGQWFGVSALAGFATHRMRAVVVGAAVLIQARVERLLGALSNNAKDFAELTRQLAIKLLTTAEEGSRLVFEDCNQRLINALLRFSESAASTRRDDGVVLRITHDQLAQAVGVARETVSLALTQLRQQNLLRTGRNQLIFNPETLRQLGLSQQAAASEARPTATAMV